jgi:hypothetical protein
MIFWNVQEELENHIDSRHPHLSVGGDFSVCLGTARSEYCPENKMPISALFLIFLFALWETHVLK